MRLKLLGQLRIIRLRINLGILTKNPGVPVYPFPVYSISATYSAARLRVLQDNPVNPG